MGNSEFKEGWTLVAATFFVCFIVDGVLFSFGVIFIEFLDDIGNSRGSTALVGSVGLGVHFLLGPISGSLVDKFGSRPLIIMGTLISFTGVLASAFVKTLPIMVVTYGLLGGTGFGLMWLPANACVIKHFTKRCALASGIAVCGTGFGTFTFSVLISNLISEYGWRMSLVITSGIILNGIPCGLILVLPPKRSQNKDTNQAGQNSGITCGDGRYEDKNRSMLNIFKCIVQENIRLIKRKTCCLNMVSAFFVGLALTIPYSLLPDSVIQSGWSKSDASWLVSSIGISNTLGRVFFGLIGDKMSAYRNTMFECMIFVQGISVGMLPLLSTLGTKLILTSSFGLSFGGFIMLFPLVLVDEFGPEQIGKSYGLIMLSVGVSSFISTPLAGWIFDVSHNYKLPFYVAGLEYFIAVLCLFVPRIMHIFKGRRERCIESTHM